MENVSMETALGQLEIQESGYTAENYPGYVVSLVRNGKRFDFAMIEVDQTDSKEEPLLKAHVWDDKNEDPVFDLALSASQLDASEMGYNETDKRNFVAGTDYEKVKELLCLAWAREKRMDKKTLFMLQKKLTEYALEVARRENKCEDLVNSFPFLYENREV